MYYFYYLSPVILSATHNLNSMFIFMVYIVRFDKIAAYLGGNSKKTHVFLC